MTDAMYDALDEIRAHLGAAKMQCAPSDDKIIAAHIDAALEIARTACRTFKDKEKS